MTWLGGGGVRVTGAPTEKVSGPAPVPGASSSTISGLLVSVTYSTLLSVFSSGSTRMPCRVVTARLGAVPETVTGPSSWDGSHMLATADMPSLLVVVEMYLPLTSAMAADAATPALAFQNCVSGSR